jgi:hypothetical protein
MSSARDVVVDHAREEGRILAKAPGARGSATPEANAFTTPGASAAIARSLREATLATLRRALPTGGGSAVVAEIVLALAQIDARAFGELVVLQRLIDPTRAPVSPG